MTPRIALVVGLVVAGAALSPFFGGSVVPEADAARKLNKEQKVRKFLHLTGADQMGKQMIEGMMDQFSKMPGVPPEFAVKFRELAMKEDLTVMTIPVYMKHLDERDLDGAIEFYESKAGRNFVKAQPAILQETMIIGQKWGQELAQQAIMELEAEERKGPARP